MKQKMIIAVLVLLVAGLSGYSQRGGGGRGGGGGARGGGGFSRGGGGGFSGFSSCAVPSKRKCAMEPGAGPLAEDAWLFAGVAVWDKAVETAAMAKRRVRAGVFMTLGETAEMQRLTEAADYESS